MTNNLCRVSQNIGGFERTHYLRNIPRDVKVERSVVHKAMKSFAEKKPDGDLINKALNEYFTDSQAYKNDFNIAKKRLPKFVVEKWETFVQNVMQPLETKQSDEFFAKAEQVIKKQELKTKELHLVG